jgi:hypothetical protein
MRELQDRFDGRRVAHGLDKHRLHFEFWEQDRFRCGLERRSFAERSQTLRQTGSATNTGIRLAVRF